MKLQKSSLNGDTGYGADGDARDDQRSVVVYQGNQVIAHGGNRDFN